MPFIPLQLDSAPGVIATITKKRVVIALSGSAVRQLGWTEDEPNISCSLGDGADAGWLRVTPDEGGTTPEEVDGHLVLTLPRSMLPDLIECRGGPLVWRGFEGGIDVRLPTVAAPGRRQPPRLAVNNVRAGQPPAQEEAAVTETAVPDLYRGLHRTAWENGVELTFLSDGNVIVNGRVVSTDDIEGIVRAAVDKRNSARQRAS